MKRVNQQVLKNIIPGGKGPKEYKKKIQQVSHSGTHRVK